MPCLSWWLGLVEPVGKPPRGRPTGRLLRSRQGLPAPRMGCGTTLSRTPGAPRLAAFAASLSGDGSLTAARALSMLFPACNLSIVGSR